MKRQVIFYAPRGRFIRTFIVHARAADKGLQALLKQHSATLKDASMAYVEDSLRSPAGQTRAVYQEYRIYQKKNTAPTIKHTETVGSLP